MEAGRRQDVHRTLQLRAELNDARCTLQALLDSAWPEEPESKNVAADLHIDSEKPESIDFDALADLLRMSSNRGKEETSEMLQMSSIANFLVCRCPEGYRGCCIVLPPSDLTATRAGATNFGAIAALVVAPETRLQGLGSRFLAAAEEWLAARHQCNSVSVVLDSTVSTTGRGWLERRGYSENKDHLAQAALTKALPVGFVSRALAREVKAREAALLSELSLLASEASAAVGHEEPVPVSEDSKVPTVEDSSDARESAVAILPYDVWAGVLRALELVEVATLGCTCALLSQQEMYDAEMWRALFLHRSWPPSEALLHFSEGVTACAAGVNWRDRLRARSTASPVIVVDMGRGYTKYDIIHGVNGLPATDPKLVQLCSSPSHPPDCEREWQLHHIQQEIDCQFELAAQDPRHPYHSAALVGAPPLAPGRRALVKDCRTYPQLNNRVVRLGEFIENSNEFATKMIVPQEDSDWEDQDDSNSEPQRLFIHATDLVSLRDAKDLPVLVGEPFVVTANSGRGGNARQLFAQDVDRQLRQLGPHPGPVRTVPQAQMALWAHGIDHGIVVNLGQAQAIAIPVVKGEIVASAASGSDVGSAQLTQIMMRLVQEHINISWAGLMTWCRDVKEQYCVVARPPPPGAVKGLRRRLQTGELKVQAVTVEIPTPAGMLAVALENERVLVPEEFFDTTYSGGPTLQRLIVSCAERVLQQNVCDAEAVQALLRNIVLVGGAANIPGLRTRTEFEVRKLLENGASCGLQKALISPDDVFVLNPPLDSSRRPLTTPRFAPFFGGCVGAASTSPMGFLAPAQQPSIDSMAEMVQGVLVPRGPTARLPDIAAWARRELLTLNAPVIFRAGGGGGEEDEIWIHEMQRGEHDDVFESPSSEESNSEVDDEGPSSSLYRARNTSSDRPPIGFQFQPPNRGQRTIRVVPGATPSRSTHL